MRRDTTELTRVLNDESTKKQKTTPEEKKVLTESELQRHNKGICPRKTLKKKLRTDKTTDNTNITNTKLEVHEQTNQGTKEEEHVRKYIASMY